MLVLKGGSTSVGVSFGEYAALPVVLTLRPWAATGTMAVDLLLVWACATQRAGMNPTAGLFAQEIAASGLTAFNASSDGCAAVERIHAAGCRVDVSGPTGQRTSPVADTVLAAAERLPIGETLIDWARLGCTPGGWDLPARAAWPRYGWLVEGVEAARTYDYAGPGRRGPSTPVVIVSPEQIAARRDEYLAWWDGLEDLAWRLSSRALGFAVLPPDAPRQPWRADRFRTVR